jgi:putative transposase
MKNGRFSDTQIMGVLKQAESGVPDSEFCHEHGMSSTSFYKWRAKSGGMDASIMSQSPDRELEPRKKVHRVEPEGARRPGSL